MTKIEIFTFKDTGKLYMHDLIETEIRYFENKILQKYIEKQIHYCKDMSYMYIATENLSDEIVNNRRLVIK